MPLATVHELDITSGRNQQYVRCIDLVMDLDAERLHGPVARLSSGECQRFALLRLLANRPRVLLLDEPTANLDPDNVSRVERLIADYIREEQAAVLWVSHDPRQMRRVADRRMRLEAGRVAAGASSGGAREQPA